MFNDCQLIFELLGLKVNLLRKINHKKEILPKEILYMYGLHIFPGRRSNSILRSYRGKAYDTPSTLF